jgi:PPOX class probable F420-dependent enzyme
MPFERDAVTKMLKPYEDLLASPVNAILAVPRAGGRGPHLTPVWFIYGDGRFYISTTRDRVKARLARRAEAVSLIVDDLETHRYVAVEAPPRFRDDDASLLRLAKELTARYQPGVTLPDDATMLARRKAEGRTVLVIEPERVIARGA